MASLNPSSDVPLETRGVLPGSKIDGDDDDELVRGFFVSVAGLITLKLFSRKL